jgi:hypothetical protein
LAHFVEQLLVRGVVLVGWRLGAGARPEVRPQSPSRPAPATARRTGASSASPRRAKTAMRAAPRAAATAARRYQAMPCAAASMPC